MAGKKKEFIMTAAHEKFCQHYSEYGNMRQAFMYAWPETKFSSAGQAASMLMKKDEITDRIQQLREEVQVEFNQTKDGTIKDLIRSAEEAKKAFQFAAYAKLREMVIELCGLYPIKQTKQDVNITAKGPIKIDFGGFDPDKADSKPETPEEPEANS